MKVNGIIAEYNPFHNGHQYQLATAKQETGADYTIIAMSGNFMQRGTPAMVDKFKRAKMALLCGADLVLELPSYYALSSAEDFAMGGVTLLDKLGVASHLCFGSECGDISVLEKIAEILVQEPAEYVGLLRGYLREGHSFPTARSKALLGYDASLTEYKDVLTSPNNILGIEYCKALLRRGSNMEAWTVKRMGADYHESTLLDNDNTRSHDTITVDNEIIAYNNATDNATETTHDFTSGKDFIANHTVSSSQLSSATAIRRAIKEEVNLFHLKKHVPEDAFTVMETTLRESQPVFANDFSSLLLYKLLQEQSNGYENFLDVSSELSDRIRNNLYDFRNFEDFCDLLKRKDMTHTRISRCLMHILLDMKTQTMESFRAMDYAPYARVLGFRKDSTPLLSAIKEHSSIPLITKLADAEEILSENAFEMLQQDLRINQIYQSVRASKNGSTMENEYRTPIVIV